MSSASITTASEPKLRNPFLPPPFPLGTGNPTPQPLQSNLNVPTFRGCTPPPHTPLHQYFQTRESTQDPRQPRGITRGAHEANLLAVRNWPVSALLLRLLKSRCKPPPDRLELRHPRQPTTCPPLSLLTFLTHAVAGIVRPRTQGRRASSRFCAVCLTLHDIMRSLYTINLFAPMCAFENSRMKTQTPWLSPSINLTSKEAHIPPHFIVSGSA
ncbi:uncharacterized protein B0I36DRAFT_132507 [Microdochium trichocladiopsis]|uniref:Uncharacterized protein n=1 Tax=Microdochium trichocladiopsis TaxID=1682393 RepID=A0A9P8Y7E4_9PEZI|nr:uncharacterized protein B0I36DRAFT_132507 [Microdochium trichocladiopsis]KAH7029422.1 hypothetical protein B0I36DRAFT_132507 [Microdochium trichocladiopsis]